jgi:transposase, IS5 family
MRSVKKRVIAIAHALRHQGPEGEQKRKKEYEQLLRLTHHILGDAKRVLQAVESLPEKRRGPVVGLSTRLEAMAEQVRRVVRQTKARIFSEVTQFPDKLFSLFEPHTELIRKGKASKPNEFGKLVQLQEAEKQIITH